jgi:hypothetical protein
MGPRFGFGKPSKICLLVHVHKHQLEPPCQVFGSLEVEALLPQVPEDPVSAVEQEDEGVGMDSTLPPPQVSPASNELRWGLVLDSEDPSKICHLVHVHKHQFEPPCQVFGTLKVEALLPQVPEDPVSGIEQEDGDAAVSDEATSSAAAVTTKVCGTSALRLSRAITFCGEWEFCFWDCLFERV